MRTTHSAAGSKTKLKGFTLIELMLAIVVISILSSTAYGSYKDAVDRARVNTAIVDIARIDVQLERFFTDNSSYPPSLVGFNDTTDPWGNPYQYVNIALETGTGKLRKDKNLVPINSDYDLYSNGPDGNSQSTLTAKQSQDDIIRARNGGFIGPAESF